MATTDPPAAILDLCDRIEELAVKVNLPSELFVGERNPGPDWSDEVAIGCRVSPNDMVGPLGRIVRRAGDMTVAHVCPIGFRPDQYRELTDAMAAYLVAACNAAPTLTAEVRRLTAHVETTARDWSDDHTHLQTLCLAAGVPKERVEGNEDHFVGIEELADLLAADNGRLTAELVRTARESAEWKAEADRLRDAVADHYRMLGVPESSVRTSVEVIAAGPAPRAEGGRT